MTLDFSTTNSHAGHALGSSFVHWTATD